jgi:twinfilin-like protein
VVVGKIAEALEPREVAGFIHKEQSQYTLYKWAANDDGAPKDAVAFIYTCPPNSKIKERMVYATMKRGVVTFTNGILTIDKVVSELRTIELPTVIA